MGIRRRNNYLLLALGVAAGWTLVAVVWAVQTTVGATLQRQAHAPSLSAVLPSALVQSLAWVPVTLGVILLTVRYPLTRTTWPRRLPLHGAAALVFALLANMLVVLGFALISHARVSLHALLYGGALWAAIRLDIAVFIYAVIAALTHAVLYYRNARERELQWARIEGQLARARLQALNAQIRPHFLFNTLHTIGQLWRSGNNEDAEVVLDRLGNLFHKLQHTMNETEVPLIEELDLVRDYLGIEQLRFRDRMTVEIAAAPETNDLLVPPLILQPIVENAVRHGISKLPQGGCLRVSAIVDGAALTLTVSDDGPGFATAESATGGTGISNTRERLQQLYGVAGQMRISANGAARGCTVELRLPAHDS